MKASEIRKYAKLMQELGLNVLEVREDEKMLRLERNISALPTQTMVTMETLPCSPAAENYISVRSPMVGVFYAAPAENAAPFVALGESVKKGKILCIIEAMKLMNEIVAEEDGEILEICVTNGQVVEYGTELFRLKR